jgi:hypothetical protein
MQTYTLEDRLDLLGEIDAITRDGAALEQKHSRHAEIEEVRGRLHLVRDVVLGHLRALLDLASTETVH